MRKALKGEEWETLTTLARSIGEIKLMAHLPEVQVVKQTVAHKSEVESTIAMLKTAIDDKDLANISTALEQGSILEIQWEEELLRTAEDAKERLEEIHAYLRDGIRHKRLTVLNMAIELCE